MWDAITLSWIVLKGVRVERCRCVERAYDLGEQHRLEYIERYIGTVIHGAIVWSHKLEQEGEGPP